MAEFPALPLWTDAYLGDTTHLTTIEHGAYLLLLIAMWRTSTKSLPNDARRLARYAKLTTGQWDRIGPTIMEFFRVDGETITQGRLTDEAAVVRQLSRLQSDKAKARWLKTNNTPMPGQCPADAPTPTPIEERIATAIPKKKAPRSRVDPGRQPDEQDRNFAEERGVNVRQEWPRFVNRHLSTGTLSADWSASWRTWCLNDVKFSAERRGSQANVAKPGRGNGFVASLLDEIDRRGHGRVDETVDPDDGGGPILEGVVTARGGAA